MIEPVARWVRVADAAAVEPGTGRVVLAGETRLALFNDGGEYFVVDDSCPHQGASLGEGFLHLGRVVCPWHNWSFEVRTGECPNAPHVRVDCYPTRVVDGAVEVQIADPGGDP